INVLNRIHTSVLLIEALLFGLFVVAVLTDQFQAICANETAIDRYLSQHSSKANKAQNKTKPKTRKLLTEVCGKGPMIWWLFPCDFNRRHHKTDNTSHFIV
ncbi:unnamed protein product, partial [Medioppia subpectinata]